MRKFVQAWRDGSRATAQTPMRLFDAHGAF
jgi:hypothetical protein